MMANGTLVRVLIHTGVTRYLSFKAVDGGYVFNKGKVQSLFSFIFIIFFYCFFLRCIFRRPQNAIPPKCAN